MAVTSSTNRAETPGEFGAARFLREVVDELRKVVWPTPSELYRYTLVVIFTVLVIGLFIGGVDYLLSVAAKQYIYNGVAK